MLNSIQALQLNEVSNSDISANTFTAEHDVVEVNSSHPNRFHANRVAGLDGDPCNRGYRLSGSDYNIVTSSQISGCDGDSGVALLGSSGNIVPGNRVNVSDASFGIVAVGGTGNIIQANRVSGGFDADLRDLSDTCDDNTWKANKFTTADPPCIE